MEVYGPSIIVPSSLAYFCVYNPTFGPTEETQKDQLLYYVAKKTVPMDVKIRQIGLAQGLIHFTRVFSPSKPCENVHTQKNRLAFYEPEPNYWIHIDKDGKPKTIVEYLDSNLHDSGIKRMLQLGYGMYKMFNGPFDMTVHTSGIKTLKNKLEEFFANWVFNWDFDKMDITKTIDGTSYLPLSSSARKQITSFMDKFQSEYNFISDILILKNNMLFYTFKDFTRTLSGSSSSLSPTNNNTEISNSTFLSPPLSTPLPSSSSPSPLSISNFLIGPQNLQGDTDGVNEEEIKPTTIYLSKKSIEKKINEEYTYDVDEYYLLSYKQNSITIVFLIPHSSLEGSKKIHDITFYRSIDTYLSSQTEDLINILNEEEERTRTIGQGISLSLI
ncbi:11627_t:CDS:2 [Diversispora eburnea]|uniref:11627_t:CDS:1 n=1 Tax=Diversispora eburnea TaxID=1213867 RepID=A0A9N8ZMK9_9GLOM|nr:11627_t:CDS:2 [Diversispora eburnea]